MLQFKIIRIKEGTMKSGLAALSMLFVATIARAMAMVAVRDRNRNSCGLLPSRSFYFQEAGAFS